MKKIKMKRGTTLTFEEGCDKYLEYCRQRNLREGTVRHYRQSYLYFFKYFDPKMPIEDIDEQSYYDGNGSIKKCESASFTVFSSFIIFLRTNTSFEKKQSSP